MENYFRILSIEEKKRFLTKQEKPFDRSLLDIWKNSKPFINNDLWLKKLNSMNLTEDEFIEIVNRDTVLVDKLNFIKDKYNLSICNKNNNKSFFSLNHSNVPLAGFFNLFNNEILNAKLNLKNKLIRHGLLDWLDIDETVNLLSFNIADSVFDMISRTLVLELNVERLKGSLSGDNSEDRFQSYINFLIENNYKIDFFEEYPILKLSVNDFLQKWIINCYELLERLHFDWDIVIDTFNINKNSKIIKFQIGAGDLHDSGKSVTIIHFETSKVVYKPRNIDIDEHFQNLIEEINRTNLKLKLRTFQVINKIDYGWIEFVDFSECTDLTQLDHYYTRFGYILFIFYLLNGTDIHFENIIANGEYPVVVDLETLFNPYIFKKSISDIDNSLNGNMENYLAESVLATALLPWKSNMKGKFVDISGLTDVSLFNPELAEPTWTSQATDRMAIASKMVKFTPGNNTPKLNKLNINPFHFYGKIVDGFDEMANYFLQNKELLIGENGSLQKFKNDTVRILFRNTIEYDQLIKASFHPDYLRNNIDREMLFDYLWYNSQNYPLLEKVITYEQKCLHVRDVPIFKIEVNGNKIRNLEEITFEKTGFELVKEKILNLTSKDIQIQKWLIQASIEPFLSPISEGRKYEFNISQNYCSKENLLLLSKNIFYTIIENSWSDNIDINWFGISNETVGSTNISTLQFDLYVGRIGITWFNLYLYKLTRDEELLKVLHLQLDSIKRKIIENGFDESLALFNGGAAGVVYLFSHVYTIFKLDYYEIALEIALKINSKKINEFDIIEGKAGLALALISLYSIKKDIAVLELINSLGDEICQNTVKTEFGFGWPDRNGILLTGFAHGVSGIAYCLSEINKIIPKKEYVDCIEQSIIYENSLYNESINNWQDLREIEVFISTEMTAWCNGAVGIGLSRLLISKNTNLNCKLDLNNAIIKTIESGFGRNHTLCHGDMGNLDFLIEVNKYDQSYFSDKDLFEYQNAIVKSVYEDGPQCSTNSAVTTFGLMTGIAGVGLQLLRIACPDEVPSILFVEIPKI